MTKGINTNETKSVLVKSAINVGALLLFLGLAFVLSRYLQRVVDLHAFESFVEGLGPWAPLAYMAFYLVAPTIFFPASILTMTAGAVFGPLWGTVYTIVSATLGATLPFLITRHFGKGALDKVAARYDHFDRYYQRFQDGVTEHGWKFVAFTRLVTAFPFLVLNYAFGLTGISVWTYMWASFLFMLPGSIMFNYIGYAGREALVGGEDLLQKISIAVGCMILLTTLPVFGRMFTGVKNRFGEEE